MLKPFHVENVKSNKVQTILAYDAVDAACSAYLNEPNSGTSFNVTDSEYNYSRIEFEDLSNNSEFVSSVSKEVNDICDVIDDLEEIEGYPDPSALRWLVGSKSKLIKVLESIRVTSTKD